MKYRSRQIQKKIIFLISNLQILVLPWRAGSLRPSCSSHRWWICSEFTHCIVMSQVWAWDASESDTLGLQSLPLRIHDWFYFAYLYNKNKKKRVKCTTCNEELSQLNWQRTLQEIQLGAPVPQTAAVIKCIAAFLLLSCWPAGRLDILWN